MRRFFDVYAKHTALNLGQVLHGLRYFHSHPDIDKRARRGTLKHLALSMLLRARRVAVDVFFAVPPPHWHHTIEELRTFASQPIGRWFQFGYCAWRFTEDGALKADTRGVDPRWDPRCR